MLSASIVTYHVDPQELSHCLRLLPDIDRIYVVDNSSTPSTRKVCEEFGTRVEYIPSSNVGYGSGHNIAIRRALEASKDADGDLHLVLNSDVDFDHAVIAKMKDVMERNPEVGLLHPKVVYPDGIPQYTCHRLPRPVDMFVRRFTPQKRFTQNRNHYSLKDLNLSEPLNIPFVSGCFMLLRLSVLKDVGLFDQRYFLYAEDIDLTRRIHRKHLTVYYPDVTIKHAHGAASRKSKRLFLVHFVNMMRYFNKWGWIFDPERTEFNTITPIKLK